MKILTHNLGFPRIGSKRELKKALEAYWAGKVTEAEMAAAAKAIRQRKLLASGSSKSTNRHCAKDCRYDGPTGRLIWIGRSMLSG